MHQENLCQSRSALGGLWFPFYPAIHFIVKDFHPMRAQLSIHRRDAAEPDHHTLPNGHSGGRREHQLIFGFLKLLLPVPAMSFVEWPLLLSIHTKCQVEDPESVRRVEDPVLDSVFDSEVAQTRREARTRRESIRILSFEAR